MARKMIWLTICFLMVLSLALSACSQDTTGQPTTTPAGATTTNPVSSTPGTTTSSAAETPKYGGTFTYRIKNDPNHFDPYYPSGNESQMVQKLWYETLCGRDLSVDRSIYNFHSTYTPIEFSRGVLAESWEVSSDYKTYTFHLRQGIHWQNIPPVNGRELTAYDVEWNWHRNLGLGSGFTEMNSYYKGNYSTIESVTAIDKYTVEFKVKQPSLQQLIILLDEVSYGHVLAREAVEEWGDVEDWQHAIGTGAFIMTDYTKGSSVTATRNPDYWGTDELNPGNALPYFDAIKMLIIPDDATAFSGLRSGTIDVVEDVEWMQAQALAKTNPELKLIPRQTNSDAIVLMVDKEPFNDIRVRKAMQMAINLNDIAQTYYGGTADPTPMGLVAIPGYYTPFEQWPKEVQEGYTYNPEGAKQLLAEAGYPNGFRTTMTVSATADLDLWQIVKAYFKAINIDMEIEVMENTAFSAYANASSHVMLGTTGTSGTLITYPPMNALNQRYSQSQRAYAWGHVSDPVYDDLWRKANTALTEEELKKYVNQADDYAISQHWVVNILPKTTYCICQPWIHGYEGETYFAFGQLLPRMWTDKGSK